MNDKIKELAQEATEWCRENAQGTPVAWEWENRFAELIVRECAKVVSEKTGPRSALNVLEHFGFEE